MKVIIVDDAGGRRVQLDRPPPRHRASHHRPQPSWLAQPGHGGRDAGEDAQQGSHPQVEVRLVRAATISSNTITHCRSAHKRVNLNVGGIKHEVMWKMLEQV